MISQLRGIVTKHEVPVLTVDVAGVGYEVQCVLPLWERLSDGEEVCIHIFTYVREDRLDLYGFSSAAERKLFLHFLNISGVGPKMALQLAAVPPSVLAGIVAHEDTRLLSSLKGVGKKMAEKLLLELSSLEEKGILDTAAASTGGIPGSVDEDALEALVNLGYDRRMITRKLAEMPEVTTTEERVKAVLRSL